MLESISGHTEDVLRNRVEDVICEYHDGIPWPMRWFRRELDSTPYEVDRGIGRYVEMREVELIALDEGTERRMCLPVLKISLCEISHDVNYAYVHEPK